MRFVHSIVKTPGASLTRGITTSQLGKPDYELALKQHEAYIQALRQCDLSVNVLKPSEELPDSVFIEDAALMTLHCAILANPGAESRKAEPAAIESTIRKFYTNLFRIKPPGTLDAGDVMMVGTHFYIGLSDRTNREGATQLIDILKNNGLTVSTIEMSESLHLKSSLSYLENNVLLASGELVKHGALKKFNIIEIPKEEAYAANSLWINDRVLVPAGFPQTLRRIEEAGYRALTVDMSEFMKLDGGLSCLSLRF